MKIAYKIYDSSLNYYNTYYALPSYIGIVLITITFVVSLAYWSRNYISISVYILSLLYMRNIACMYGKCSSLAWMNLFVFFIVLYSSIYILIYKDDKTEITQAVTYINNNFKRDVFPI